MKTIIDCFTMQGRHEMKENTDMISIRVSPELKASLKKAAALKQMSIAEYAIPILKEHSEKDIANMETTYGPLLKTWGIASLATLPLALLSPVAATVAAAAAAGTVVGAIKGIKSE
ncbi:MAG: DUF1778 domain-containing protein [Treponema sp.]|jgi:hypothetical protein|nr:DUF1778 domain-containing protein [Treponema sp.]